MQLLAMVILLTMIYGGGGVTKSSGFNFIMCKPDESRDQLLYVPPKAQRCSRSVSQFWAEDYKIFEKLYGKTSDKEIYGANLPQSYSYTEPHLLTKPEALEKKERVMDNDEESSETDAQNAYNFEDSFANLLKNYEPNAKSTKQALKFVTYSDFKPISHNSDPETYNYLKHLEQYQKRQNYEFPKGIGGFKPYLSYSITNPQDSDNYKSIQGIIDAHEANKAKSINESDEQADFNKYLTYEQSKSRNNNYNPRYIQNNSLSKPKCVLGRCRKRNISNSNNYHRLRNRPYVRKIKQYE